MLHQKVVSHLFLAINKKNNRHTTPPQNHIAFVMPRPKGIVSLHKSGTGKNQSRQRTTPHDNRCFNCKYSHSKTNLLSSLVIPVPTPLNYSVINPTQLSSVCQHSSISSHNTTPELQASSIPSRNSPDPKSTMPPPSTRGY